MSNKNFSTILMALVAMSFFTPSISFAIKTPDTSKELSKEEPSSAPVEEVDRSKSSPVNSASQRRLQQHGIGLGLGQTFLFGNYGKHGNDKITVDLLYSYAASYSFDLLVDAHISEHKDKNERTKVMGLSTSIKGRLVEFDNLSPYFLGGLGFYAPKMKREVNGKSKWSDQKLTFGLNFGGGVDLRLNDNYVVGVMGQMHWPFKVQQSDQPDVKGYYMKLLITGMYLF